MLDRTVHTVEYNSRWTFGAGNVFQNGYEEDCCRRESGSQERELHELRSTFRV